MIEVSESGMRAYLHLVARAENLGLPLGELPMETWLALIEDIPARDAKAILDYVQAVSTSSPLPRDYPRPSPSEK